MELKATYATEKQSNKQQYTTLNMTDVTSSVYSAVAKGNLTSLKNITSHFNSEIHATWMRQRSSIRRL